MDDQNDYKSLVNEHYKKQAEEHNLELTSTMPDQNIRKKEIENIVKYLDDDTKCLEVGTRVIYAALAKANNIDMVFNSKIDSFFSHFPAYGNFVHIKILVFKKEN